MIKEDNSNHKHQLMGIVNLTPDSFSDGGSFNNSKGLIKKISELELFNVKMLDFGAESTAPFNKKISDNDEMERFTTLLFPLLNKSNFEDDTIFSIDTYRGETFKSVYREIKKNSKKSEIIWNDVSGVLDDDVLTILDECADAKYVYCHTSTKEREEASNHIDRPFIFNKTKNLSEIEEYFESAREYFSKQGILHRIIFDPCFGFSKDASYNLSLITDTPNLIERFPESQRWLLGISRKSFLKKLVMLDSINSTQLQQSEYLHVLILSNWIDRLKDFNIIYRLHDPAVYNSICTYKTNF